MVNWQNQRHSKLDSRGYGSTRFLSIHSNRLASTGMEQLAGTPPIRRRIRRRVRLRLRRRVRLRLCIHIRPRPRPRLRLCL